MRRPRNWCQWCGDTLVHTHLSYCDQPCLDAMIADAKLGARHNQASKLYSLRRRLYGKQPRAQHRLPSHLVVHRRAAP